MKLLSKLFRQIKRFTSFACHFLSEINFSYNRNLLAIVESRRVEGISCSERSWLIYVPVINKRQKNNRQCSKTMRDSGRIILNNAERKERLYSTLAVVAHVIKDEIFMICFEKCSLSWLIVVYYHDSNRV